MGTLGCLKIIPEVVILLPRSQVAQVVIPSTLAHTRLDVQYLPGWVLTDFHAALLSLCVCSSCLGTGVFPACLIQQWSSWMLPAAFSTILRTVLLSVCEQKELVFLLFSHGMLQNIKCELVSCGKKLTLICSFWGYCEFIITGVLKIVVLVWKLFTYQHEQ